MENFLYETALVFLSQIALLKLVGIVAGVVVGLFILANIAEICGLKGRESK